MNEEFLIAVRDDGDLKTVKYMVENGIDINTKYGHHYKITALSHACLWNNYQIAKYLLEKGASIDNVADGSYSYSTLCMAALYSTPRMIKLILDHGGDINKAFVNIDHSIISILDLCVRPQHFKYQNALYLIDNGANVTSQIRNMLDKKKCNRCDHNGNTDHCDPSFLTAYKCERCNEGFHESHMRENNTICRECYSLALMNCLNCGSTLVKEGLCKHCSNEMNMGKTLNETHMSCNSCNRYTPLNKDLCVYCEKQLLKECPVCLDSKILFKLHGELHEVCLECYVKLTKCPICRADID